MVNINRVLLEILLLILKNKDSSGALKYKTEFLFLAPSTVFMKKATYIKL